MYDLYKHKIIINKLRVNYNVVVNSISTPKNYGKLNTKMLAKLQQCFVVCYIKQTKMKSTISNNNLDWLNGQLCIENIILSEVFATAFCLLGVLRSGTDLPFGATAIVIMGCNNLDLTNLPVLIHITLAEITRSVMKVLIVYSHKCGINHTFNIINYVVKIISSRPLFVKESAVHDWLFFNKALNESTSLFKIVGFILVFNSSLLSDELQKIDVEFSSINSSRNSYPNILACSSLLTKYFIKPFITKLEGVSPGCTLALITITYKLSLSSGNNPNKRHSLSSEIPLKELIVNKSTERFSKDFTIVSR
ncbi:hypothetical protein AGLY_002439 [Aphis glycines]|uniref:Uncharacterized protein n=1 Tax=Aphis glycines TaxID=307491 RepID=A0A6G0U087_APHGL|nr:hypothetical protein AGLY_002439 [Aphis glycines]